MSTSSLSLPSRRNGLMKGIWHNFSLLSSRKSFIFPPEHTILSLSHTERRLGRSTGEDALFALIVVPKARQERAGNEGDEISVERIASLPGAHSNIIIIITIKTSRHPDVKQRTK